MVNPDAAVLQGFVPHNAHCYRTAILTAAITWTIQIAHPLSPEVSEAPTDDSATRPRNNSRPKNSSGAKERRARYSGRL